MAYPQQYQSGNYPQSSGSKGYGRQQKEVLNKAEYTGIVRPLSKNENDPIKFYPFKTGGGIIHFVLKVTEPYLDANLQPKYNEQGLPMVITTPINVDVRTNKNITPEMLASIVPGMKVHVVGRTRHTAYKDQKTGEDKFKEICDAYVFNILAGPMEQTMGGMPQYQAPMQPQQPQPYGYAPQYPQGPQYGQQMPPQYNPQFAPQQMPPQQAQSQRAQQQAPVPPYYQPAPPPGPEDMPADICPQDAPNVKDINL